MKNLPHSTQWSVRCTPYLVFLCLSFVLVGPAVGKQYLPLIVIERSYLAPQSDIPLVTIGTLPEDRLTDIPRIPQTFTNGAQPSWDTFPENNHAIIDAIANGTIKFAGPIAGRTVLLLAAPMLWSRQSWIPSAITLQDKTITLEISAWDGTLSTTGKNVARRFTYLISLASLPVGNYVFRLHCTHLAQQSDDRYRRSQIDGATTPLAIYTAADKKHSPTLVPLSALKAVPLLAKDGIIEFLPPTQWARLSSTADWRGHVFQIGTMDAYKFFEENGAKIHLAPPRLQINAANEYRSEDLVALIHPGFDSGNWIRLRDITIDGQHIIINAEYWVDVYNRAANPGEAPFIIIPLYSLSKGSYQITLNWREYHGQSLVPGSPILAQTPYTESGPESQFKPSTINFSVR